MKQLLVLAFATLGLSGMSQVQRREVVVGRAIVDSTAYIAQVFVQAGGTDQAVKEVYRQLFQELKNLPDSRIDLLFYDTPRHAARGRSKLERECGYLNLKVITLQERRPVEAVPATISE